MKENKKKSVETWIGIAAGILIVALRFVVDNGGATSVLLPLIMIALVVCSVVLQNKKQQSKQGKAAAATKTAAPARRAPTQPTVKLHSDAKPHSDFPAPEAYCLVCKNSGEDHLAIDRARRIRQLDDWLKNGLIDKAEYRVLKESFEKNG